VEKPQKSPDVSSLIPGEAQVVTTENWDT